MLVSLSVVLISLTKTLLFSEYTDHISYEIKDAMTEFGKIRFKFDVLTVQ